MGKNGVEGITVNGIKWPNETNIEEQLSRVNFKYTSRQYSSEPRKQRQDLIKYWIKQPCRIFLREDLAIQLIMDSRTVSSVKFKSTLGFKNQDPIMTQEQSVFTKIKETFSTEEMF